MPASAELKITGFAVEGESLRITFEDPDGLNNPLGNNQFALQKATGLNLDSWKGLPAATFVPINGTTFQFTVPKSEADREFFRIIGSFFSTALDPDGDGLPETIETTLGTFTDKFDSDGDGFSDGAEFAYGTDPLSAASKPVLFDLPTVNFVDPDSLAAEGNSPHQIAISFDTTYNGVLNYAVNPTSNTTAGVDFSLSGGSPTATAGSVTVNGTSASIPLTLLDDTIVSGQRVIIIELQLNGENYFIGGEASHIVLLEDNDAWWTGNLLPRSGEADARLFRLKLAKQGGTATALFGAGAGNDGLTVPEASSGGEAPPIGATSISSGLIPVGQWLGTGVGNTGTQFHADSPVMPFTAPPGSFFAGDTFGRQLILNANAALNTSNRPHVFQELRIVGDYTEILTNGSGGTLSTLPGTFTLVKDLPAPLPILSELVPPAP